MSPTEAPTERRAEIIFRGGSILDLQRIDWNEHIPTTPLGHIEVDEKNGNFAFFVQGDFANLSDPLGSTHLVQPSPNAEEKLWRRIFRSAKLYSSDQFGVVMEEQFGITVHNIDRPRDALVISCLDMIEPIDRGTVTIWDRSKKFEKPDIDRSTRLFVAMVLEEVQQKLKQSDLLQNREIYFFESIGGCLEIVQSPKTGAVHQPVRVVTPEQLMRLPDEPNTHYVLAKDPEEIAVLEGLMSDIVLGFGSDERLKEFQTKIKPNQHMMGTLISTHSTTLEAHKSLSGSVESVASTIVQTLESKLPT